MSAEYEHADMSEIARVKMAIGHTCVVILLLCGCYGDTTSNPVLSDGRAVSPSVRATRDLHLMDRYPVRIAKWFGNKPAAISLTYDSGSPSSVQDREVQSLVRSRNMVLDYELVTQPLYSEKRAYIRNVMIPAGFSFFGHGHKHVNHDALSYGQAYESFQQCRREMVAMGLVPIAYAYPGGMGQETETRSALKAAGFLSGRLFNASHRLNPYIMPDEDMSPKDWYGLPSLVMFDSDSFPEADRAINTTEELTPYLDEAVNRRAWLILTYHDIGGKPGSGHYTIDSFQSDLDAVARRDFWVASTNEVTLYARERERSTVEYEYLEDVAGNIKAISVIVNDRSDDPRYDQPLTILFTIPESWKGRSMDLYDGGSLIGPGIIQGRSGQVNLIPGERRYEIRPSE